MIENKFSIIDVPKYSNWECYLFGAKDRDSGITWHAFVGNVPNWFWRKMQYLCFGNRWVKINKEEKK